MQRIESALVLAMAVVVHTLVTAAGANAACCGDCEGDGMVSIDNLIVAVHNALSTGAESCTIAQEAADVSGAQAVGISPDRLRVSGTRSGGEIFVLDLERHGDAFRVVEGSATRSAAPSISNLQATQTNDATFCGSQYPQRLQLRFDFQDANADLLGGFPQVRYAWILQNGTSVSGSFSYSFFPPPQWGAQLSSITATSGVATLETCWSGVSNGDVYVTLYDGARNASTEIGISVTFL